MRSNPEAMKLIGGLMRSKSPEDFVLNLLQQRAGDNELMANLFALAKNQDAQGIEGVARNMLKERGFNFDKEFKDFMQQLGL